MFDDFLEEDEDFEADASPAAPAEDPLALPRASALCLGFETQESQLLSLFNQGLMPHALILSGPKGIGKATFAFRLARFLLKHGGDDASQDSLFGDAPEPARTMDVSEDDPVFRKVLAGGHPDLLTVERAMDDKKGTQKSAVDVESVRKVAPFLRMTSSEGGWRVVIIDDAETMNRNAQNALLKILEEPPQKALLILVCHRIGAMIPTIRSRCRVLHFQAQATDIFNRLFTRAAPEIREKERAHLYNMAGGSFGRALSLYEEGGIGSFETVLALFSGFPQWNWPQIHQLAESASRFGQDQAYEGTREIILFICETILFAKARREDGPPPIIDMPGLDALYRHYSLEQWSEICEKLKAHFIAVDVSNLDKRQGIFGAFGLIGGLY